MKRKWRFRFRDWWSSRSRRRTQRLEVDADGYRRDYLQEIETVPRNVSPRVFPERDRLRAARYEHAVRSGTDGVLGDAAIAGIGFTTKTRRHGEGGDKRRNCEFR